MNRAQNFILVSLVDILLTLTVSCAPSASAVQTAIAQTQTAMPTSTHEPTSTSTSEPTSTNTPKPPSPTKTPETGNWITYYSTSDFDDSKVVLIYKDADKAVHGWLDTTTPELCILCKENDFQIYINVHMLFDVEYGLYKQSTIRLRFDKGEDFKMIALQSTDGNSVFINDPGIFFNKMVKAKVLVFGFTPFNASPVSTTFDLTGLVDAVRPVLETCK